jgi:hypothetical protein
VELRAYALAGFDTDGRLLRVDAFNEPDEAQATSSSRDWSGQASCG